MTCPHCAEHERTIAADVAILRTALVRCGEVFREYEAIHAAKPDEVKALRNRQMATLCESALAGIHWNETRRAALAAAPSAGNVTEPAEPMAKHWRQAFVAWTDHHISSAEIEDLDWIEQRARELAGKDRA